VRRFLLYPLLLVAAGCFERSTAQPRFFRPDSTLLGERTDAVAQEARPSRSPVTIRLRTVEAGPFLRERIVWRASSVEYGLYEQRRWRDVPASYVERALRAALRRTGDVRLSDDPHARSLQIEVIAFDEVLEPAHAAVVEVALSLRDGSGQLLLDGPFGAEAPIVDDDPATMARAMGSALDAVASNMAEAISKAVVPRKP
jgi:uncharacterized lipoprotein YmbA